MLLRDLLICLSKKELVEIIYKGLSKGAYSVEEILSKENALLDKCISENGIEICIGKLDSLVAEDSKVRDEFFQKDKEWAYVVVEAY